MNIYEFERDVALHTYETPNGATITLTYFEKNVNGGTITTTLPNHPTLSAPYRVRIEEEIIYFKMMDAEYILNVLERDDKRIVAFELLMGDKVFHSFRFVG